MTILNKRDPKALDIFEKFKIDGNLPKHQDLNDDQVRAVNSGRGRNMNTAVYSSGAAFDSSARVYSTTTASTGTSTGTSGFISVDGLTSNTVHVVHSGTPDDFDRASSTPPRVEDQGITNEDIVIDFQTFFNGIRHQAGWLTNLRYRRKVKGLEKMLEQAERNGQAALKDMSLVELSRVKLEYILASKGFNTYVDEKVVVEGFNYLSEEDQAKITMDWISDFTRIIPQKIIKRKEKADKLHVFDNYVVLHIAPHWYPEQKERKTQQEVDREKDPILFGVMDCSRRLYYIGDWVDQYCDLNLADMIDRFGANHTEVHEIWSRVDTRLPFDAVKKLPNVTETPYQIEKQVN